VKYDKVEGLSLGIFRIERADISKVKIMLDNREWTGRQIKPSGFRYNGRDFSIRANARVNAYGRNRNIGRGTVRLTGVGNFAGTRTVTFHIVPRRNSVSRITVRGNQMQVTWRRTPSAQRISNYEVRYRVRGMSRWRKRTYAPPLSTATIKNLRRHRRYEVQVRSYKRVAGRRYYSQWSNVKIGRTR
jgi:hypothetical protein